MASASERCCCGGCLRVVHGSGLFTAWSSGAFVEVDGDGAVAEREGAVEGRGTAEDCFE